MVLFLMVERHTRQVMREMIGNLQSMVIRIPFFTKESEAISHLKDQTMCASLLSINSSWMICSQLCKEERTSLTILLKLSPRGLRQNTLPL
jgi:hypothetical protein